MAKNSARFDERIVGSPVLHLLSMVILLYGFWLLLSGNPEPKFLMYGAATAIVSAWATYPLLLMPNADDTKRYFLFALNPFKLAYYLVWLSWQLILANLDVLQATVLPDVAINPRVVRFRYVTENPFSNAWLANSITLTPGTVTLSVSDDGLFEVHALTDGAADGLKEGAMQQKVAWLLGVPYEFTIIEEDF